MAIKYIDIYTDGNYYDKIDQKNLLGKVLSLVLYDLKYMSEDAMKNALVTTTDLAEESIREFGGNSTLMRKISFIRDYLSIKELNRKVLLSIITNMILSSEGLGTLPGFGYSSSNSGYKINPEIISMREVE